MTIKNLFSFLLIICCANVLFAREFPLCMYSVSDVEDLSLLKKAGFTCIQSYVKEPEKLALLAQEAAKQGLKTVFYPQQVIGSSYEKQASSWPVLAWYIVDEPDVAKWSRPRVQEQEKKAKTVWPQHLTSLVVGRGRTLIPYYDLTDVMMVDWYPVPHLELTSFGDNVAWTKQGMKHYGADDHPLWGVVQAFDWKEFKQYRPDNDRIGRFPTKEEIRFMSYDGIINGATGLFYFHFNSFDKKLPAAQPEYWERLTAVIKELGKLRPVLEQGELIGNALEVKAPLILQARRYKGHTYFFLLNRSKQEQLVPAPLLTKRYKIMFGDVKAEKIAPYGVWVLKI